MRVPRTLSNVVALVVVCGLAAASASAQASRTWVSGVGDDANPCSRTAPCKTFAGAISKTAAAGTINIIDAGGFGAVTITKSITIQADGMTGGVLAAGTTGIVVNAGATDQVVLRGLLIDGFNTGLNGVRFLGGLSLAVEDCQINRFTEEGIEFTPSSGTAALFVKDTVIRNNNYAAGGGILVRPGAGASALVTLDNVLLERNAYGVKAEAGSSVTLHGCTVTRNGRGLWALATSSPAEINLVDTVVTHGTVSGVTSEGAAATVRLNRASLFKNAAGLLALSSGAIVSYGNNANSDSGAPTVVVAEQ